MLITTFDLYWNIKSNNHGINTYHDVFFNWKNLKYNKIDKKEVSKNQLTQILNKSDYKICHNFYWYDWNKLPSLNDHFKNNIDTLLIDCLISFNKTHHNLKKSIDNNPLEDAKTTFEVLEKNIIKFHNFSENIKNILYSILNWCEKYNDFFYFYEKVSKKKLKLLNNDEIQIELKSNNLEKYLNTNNNNHKLAIVYLVMFLYKKSIVLPEFIYKNNIELKNTLANILNPYYSKFQSNFHKNIKQHLKDFSWFDSFRWQTQIKWVENWLNNNDFLTILSTWGWKSLIYQLPAWLVWKKLGQLTLIITPLKALIKDQIDWLRNKDFNDVDYLSGDQNWIEKDMIYNKIKSWKTKILFITPEALRSEKILDLLENRYIARVVIDEAHTLILWWQEFRPDYFFIKHFINDLEKINLNKKINITLLTATATVDVEKWIIEYFEDRKIKQIKAKDILKENIKWSVINIKNPKNKIEILLNKIKEIDINNNPTIIFTWRRKTAEEIEKHIQDEWINIKYFHAWMFLKDKKQVQENFKSWKLNLIVATKAFWMWIDKENVRYVIHYDLPWNIEDYTQEIWRAWRDWKYSQNIIFYDKKDIEKRIKLLNNSWLRYFNIQNFLKRIKLDNKKNKYICSPRQIALLSWIKTNKKNWITETKNLLSFLELEKFDWKTILNRKYDNTYVLFNKIEKKMTSDSYNDIKKYDYLNDDEKRIAKEIIYKIIEQKIAIDLNKLEENFIEDLGENFNFKNVSINKITKIIKKFEILSKSKDNEETDIVIEAWTIKDKNYRDNIFNIFNKRVKIIDTFKEANEKSSFYDKIKNYYLFINYIKEKKWVISINNKNKLLQHYKEHSVVWKIILWKIFTDDKSYNNKQTVDLNILLLYLQKKYKKNYTISELKETLFFLHKLDIIKIKNWLLVFLTRFSIYFNKEIIDNIDNFKKEIQTEDFVKKLIIKLDEFKQVKVNKLLALQKIVEILESKWSNEYTKLTEYYFTTPIKKFSKEYLSSKLNKTNIFY